MSKSEATKKVKVIEDFTVNRMVDGKQIKKRYTAGEKIDLPTEMVERLNGGVVNTNMSTPVRVLKDMSKKKNRQ